MEIKDYTGKLVIHGTMFEAVEREWIREVGQQTTLQSLSALSEDSGYLKGYYNLKDKTIQALSAVEQNVSSNIKPIWIPVDALKKSIKISQEWAQRLNARSRIKGLGVVLVDEKTNLRLNGALPEAELLGMRYQLDVPNRKLCSPDLAKADISFPRMMLHPGLGNQFFIYQPSLNKMLPVNEDRLYTIEPLLVVEFPSPMLVDPVGVALAESKPGTAFLNEYPQQDFLKLKTYQINDPDLPEKVRKNVEATVRFDLADAAFKPNDLTERIATNRSLNKRRRL